MLKEAGNKLICINNTTGKSRVLSGGSVPRELRRMGIDKIEADGDVNYSPMVDEATSVVLNRFAHIVIGGSTLDYGEEAVRWVEDIVPTSITLSKGGETRFNPEKVIGLKVEKIGGLPSFTIRFNHIDY